MAATIPFDPRRHIRSVFSTPVGAVSVVGADELMPRFAEAILGRRTGAEASGHGCWQSGDDPVTWPELQFADLKTAFSSAVSKVHSASTGIRKFRMELGVKARAHVHRPLHCQKMQVHPGSHWAGMMWVRVPDTASDPVDSAGQVEFLDPRGPVDMVSTPGCSDVHVMTPEEGKILVFPSWLYHRVNPFSVASELIYITFNAYIQRFEPQ